MVKTPGKNTYRWWWYQSLSRVLGGLSWPTAALGLKGHMKCYTFKGQQRPGPGGTYVNDVGWREQSAHLKGCENKDSSNPREALKDVIPVADDVRLLWAYSIQGICLLQIV